MNDENDNDGQSAEQWAAFQKIWMETFTKLMQLGFTFSPESAPPEFLRQMRSGILQGMGQAWEHFLRSPQFMESTRQWMDKAIAFRKMSSDFFNRMRHETQTTTREDIDSVMLAVRHMETRVLDRVEELAIQVRQLSARLEGQGEPPGPAAPSSSSSTNRGPKARKAANPRRK